MSQMIISTKKAIKLLSVIFILFIFNSTIALEDIKTEDPFLHFGQYTEGSDLKINHSIWSEILYTSVAVVPPSNRTMASTKNNPATGTNIKRGSSSPARYESNRVVYHLLKKDNIALVTKYREELERLPDYFPLAGFSKDEQLAYWLNLYNAMLYEQIAKRYPLSRLKKLRIGKANRPSLWDEKLLTVEGIPLSLNDIQNNILIRHWNTPMILYGLYHGTIGGPSLPNFAYTSANVHRVLRRTGREFVNSNRGFRIKGYEAQVSLLYEWGQAAFPDWEDDVARHLFEMAKGSQLTNLRNVDRFIPKFYDWYIADTRGGTLSAGPIISTAANLLAGGRDDTGSTRGIRGGFGSLATNMMRDGLIVPGAIDVNTAKLLRNLARKIDNPTLREGIVVSEECGTEECPASLSDSETEDK